MKIGIVGLPNVGKSTLFNAITKAGAECANYPFCTIEPNIGMVPVPDDRLDNLAKIYDPEKVTHAVIEFVDIAGLVKGASKGEGLGNKFLSHIREVDSILGIVYFVLKIFEYGFYYLFLIGSLVSIAGLGVSVYGCYKLWKKNKNPKTFVDSWQKTENAAELLDEKTILLEDEDDRTV